jgi:hypothetical protein
MSDPIEVTDYRMRIPPALPREVFLRAMSGVLQEALLKCQPAESGRITVSYQRRGGGASGDPVRYVMKVLTESQMAESVTVVADDKTSNGKT